MSFQTDYSQFSPEDQARMRTAEFGLKVVEFSNTDIGVFLLERASQEREQALQTLAEVNAADADAVRELQLIVRRCDSFRQWLESAVIDGENAETELRTASEG